MEENAGGNMLVEKMVHGSRMLLDTDDPGISSQLMSGTRELGAPILTEELVQPDWVCIDAGANIGFYALIEARAGARVYAIEPMPHNVDLLTKNLELNGYDNVSVHALALGDKHGDCEMIIRDHCNACAPLNKAALSERVEQTLTVQEVTLDSFVEEQGITRVDFLRHDMEGYEVEMYKGAQNTLRNIMPQGSWIFGELHANKFEHPEVDFQPAIENLIEIGFKPKYIIHICMWNPPAFRYFCTPLVAAKEAHYACELSSHPHTVHDHAYTLPAEDFAADISRNGIMIDGGRRYSQWAFLQKGAP
jgi:FkbM family methyltransferase